MPDAEQLHALLSEYDAGALHHVDEEFGQLLQRYFEATRAMRASEAGDTAHDDFTLYRLHREHETAAERLLQFFEDLGACEV